MTLKTYSKQIKVWNMWEYQNHQGFQDKCSANNVTKLESLKLKENLETVVYYAFWWWYYVFLFLFAFQLACKDLRIASIFVETVGMLY